MVLIIIVVVVLFLTISAVVYKCCLSDSSTATEVAKKQAAMQQHQRQNQSDGRVILSPPYSGGLPPSHYLQPPIAGETTSLYSSVSPYYYPTPAPGTGVYLGPKMTNLQRKYADALNREMVRQSAPTPTPKKTTRKETFRQDPPISVETTPPQSQQVIVEEAEEAPAVTSKKVEDVAPPGPPTPEPADHVAELVETTKARPGVRALAVRILTTEYVKSLPATAKDELLELCKEAFEAPDQDIVGCRAFKELDYTTFSQFFRKLRSAVAASTNRPDVSTKVLRNECTTTILVHRNVAGFSMMPKLAVPDRVRLEESLLPFFNQLKEACQETKGGVYRSFTPGHPTEVSTEERTDILAWLLSESDAAGARSDPEWLYGKGCFLNDAGVPLVLVGFGDEHITIRCEKTSRVVLDAFETVGAILAVAEKLDGAKFMKSETFGWLTSRPEYSGVGVSKTDVKITIVDGVKPETVNTIVGKVGVRAQQGKSFGGTVIWQLSPEFLACESIDDLSPNLSAAVAALEEEEYRVLHEGVNVDDMVYDLTDEEVVGPVPRAERRTSFDEPNIIEVAEPAPTLLTSLLGDVPEPVPPAEPPAPEPPVSPTAEVEPIQPPSTPPADVAEGVQPTPSVSVPAESLVEPEKSLESDDSEDEDPDLGAPPLFGAPLGSPTKLKPSSHTRPSKEEETQVQSLLSSMVAPGRLKAKLTSKNTPLEVPEPAAEEVFNEECTYLGTCKCPNCR